MIVTRRFGSDAWSQLFANVAASHPCFRSPLTAASQVPLSDFLAFHDEIARRLFAGDLSSYGELGEQSAVWALEDGPYRKLIAGGALSQFVEAFPQLWHTYFAETTSTCRAALVGNNVELEVSGLPEWHPYFEYLVAGYMKGALGLLCVNPIEAMQVRGGSGRGYKYLFGVGVHARPSTEKGVTPGKSRPSDGGDLSSREIEVLRLIAHGKTNKEIGALLGISDRTVQVHASHSYDKIGVTNRAGATLWIAEHLLRLH